MYLLIFPTEIGRYFFAYREAARSGDRPVSD